MTTILVLGGAGLIGKPVIEGLSARGHDVVCGDIVTDPELEVDVPTVRCDVTDPDDVGSVIRDHGPDTVVHLAYIVGGDTMTDLSRSVRVNVLGMDTVFRAAAERDVGQVVWASTVGAYGPQETYGDVTITEDAIPDAAFARPDQISYYASMKQQNEYQARVYAEEYGLAVQAVRPSTVFGARRASGFPWLSRLVEDALGDGTHIPYAPDARMNLVHVDDVARLFVEVASADEPTQSAYNTGGHTLTIAEIASAVEDATGGTVTYDEDGGEGPLAWDISNDRAAQEFGFELTPFEEALRGYVDAVSG